MKHILTITDKEITSSDKLSTAHPRIAVNAILFDADENIALCYMGKYDLHTLPGGGVEVGEDLQSATQREIWEETGCQCEIIGELGKIIENRYDHDFTQERSYYIARVTGEKGELNLTDEEIAENMSVVWLPIEQALRIISEKEHDNYQRKFIQKRDIATLTEAILWMMLHDIPDYDSFVKIEAVNKGMSSDKKYCIITADGANMLLRVADITEHNRKKTEFDFLHQVCALGAPTCQPIDFGICNNSKSVYQLLTWVEGEEVEIALPQLSEAQQYDLGLQAGKALRLVHSVSAPTNMGNWEGRYFSIIDERLESFHQYGDPFDGDKTILEYLDNNRNLLAQRPQYRHHGDYHEGNMILSPEGKLYIIDWHTVDFDNIGDPWYEFNRLDCTKPHFATGQLRGYFNGEPPKEFWKLLAYYQAASAITSIAWAKYHAPEELSRVMQMNREVLTWYDGFKRVVPSWYLKDFYVQWIDGIPYKLKAPFDFSFISKYGKVFKVFDGQDSGNICFGIKNKDKRYFIKFAGAPTDEYTGTVESAIERLRAAVSPYKDLAHPNLIHFIKAEEIGDGFAVTFEWVDGICAHPMYPSDYRKFRQLPLDIRLQIYEDILEFHAFVASQGYMAVDFYDGSIMWDVSNMRTIICDIDFYTKAKVYGSEFLWGHMQSASPEERTDGAIIDEISNVYNMGETAFTLFIGRKSDRSREAWPLSDSLYDVVKKAVSDERNKRQQSIAQFIEEWRETK